MKFILSFLAGIVIFIQVEAQAYSTLNAHSHNDYANEIPFWRAYYSNFGSIEADIFLVYNQLFVAHTAREIKNERTLDALYLLPLRTIFDQNGGKAWANNEGYLQLLIDIKTEATSTLKALSDELARFPDVFDPKVNKHAVRVVISGNTPAPENFVDFPDFISFDGRINISYNASQLNRVAMFSENFARFSNWNGKGIIPAYQQKRITATIDSVHSLGKKFRFWNVPDNINGWKGLINLKVDFLGTDNISKMAQFLNTRGKSEYTATEQHEVYTPAFGYLNKKGKVKNVILLFGDGMGLAQLYAGYTANGGKLTIFNMKEIGFSKTSSADDYITDSAAGGSAIATGKKTKNRSIGVDTTGKSCPNLAELLYPKGLKCGVVSAGDITDATPAVFYAHQVERDWSERIAADFMNSNIDVLIGGNPSAFSKRHDNRNLLTELAGKNYQILTDFNEIDQIKAGKAVILDDSATRSKIKGRGDFLRISAQKSISLLSNPKGFFLMIEGAQIDYGGHANNIQYVVREMLDFDLAVAEALRFADKDGETLVIVTADHETGGLTLLGGDYSRGMVDGQFSSTDHTAVMVPVFAYGPHSEDFRGVYENTEIFLKILNLFKPVK